MGLTPRDVVLVVGSTMRLSRLVVADDLGRWMVVWPAYRWAERHRRPLPPAPGPFAPEQEWAPNWRDRLVTGLDCPFCVGTWIGFAVLGATSLSSPQTRLGRLWRFVMAGLALNEVAAHLGARLGDTAPDPDNED
jgi:hypothetical protein